MTKRRRKGTGYIRFHHGCYRLCIRLSGVEKSFSLGNAHNEKEANEAADQILQQLNVFKSFDTREELALFVGKAKKLLPGDGKLRLEDGFERFLKWEGRRSCGKDYLDLKRYVWKEFVSFCSGRGITGPDDVQLEHLNSFRTELQRTRKPKTCNEYMLAVLQILRALGVQQERFEAFRPLPYDSEPMEFFSSEELAAVMRAVDGEMKLSLPYREEMKVLFRILAWSGLRLKDACLFQWRGINLDRKIILTRPYKTEHSSGALVALPIHPDLEKALQTARQWQDDSGYVLPHVAKRYLANKCCLQHEVARTIDWTFWTDKKPNRRPPKAGKYGAHSFRHTFATFLMNNGVDPEIIAKMLGQKSLAITRIYMHLVPQTVQKIMAALPKLD